MGRVTEAVKHLLIINIIFFIITSLYGDVLYEWFALFFPENENFRFWQLVSHMFMHASLPNFAHILFNMYALWAFGSSLEQIWGKRKFLFFYFSAGIGAALIHTLVNYYYFNEGLDLLVRQGFDKVEILQTLKEGKYNTSWQSILSEGVFKNFMSAYNTPTVGASGAIYGILVAFAMSFPNAELMLIFLPIPIKAKYFIPVLILLDLFSGVTGFSLFSEGVAHFAHVGGALFGFIMMWFWKKNQFNDNRWD